MIQVIWTYLSAVLHACIVDRAGLDGLGPVGVCWEIVMAPDRPSTASKQASKHVHRRAEPSDTKSRPHHRKAPLKSSSI